MGRFPEILEGIGFSIGNAKGAYMNPRQYETNLYILFVSYALYYGECIDGKLVDTSGKRDKC